MEYKLLFGPVRTTKTLLSGDTVASMIVSLGTSASFSAGAPPSAGCHHAAEWPLRVEAYTTRRESDVHDGASFVPSVVSCVRVWDAMSYSQMSEP